MNRSPLHTKALAATLLTTAGIFMPGVASADRSPAILGWVEQVAILDAAITLPAKIDTGADNSSINASAINYITRNGADWVRFTLKDSTGTQTTLERPLVRRGQIKRKEGGFIERPVITMSLCLAGQRVDTEVNLADRNHFNYPMLVGRSLLSRRFLVDAERKNLTRPNCVTKPINIL